MLRELSHMLISMAEQDAQPRITFALWKANMDDPNFQDPDPAVTILDNTTSNFLMLKKVSGISLSYVEVDLILFSCIF